MLSQFKPQTPKRPMARLGRFGLGVLTLSAMALPLQAAAGEANVLKVKAVETSANVWTFSVTVRHKDKGWKHYANNWEVLSPDGKILATRVLGHPHVKEQPFRRSLSGVKLPQGLTEVIIRAHDSVHGYGGKQLRVDLTTGKSKRDETEFAAPNPEQAQAEVKTDN